MTDVNDLPDDNLVDGVATPDDDTSHFGLLPEEIAAWQTNDDAEGNGDAEDAPNVDADPVVTSAPAPAPEEANNADDLEVITAQHTAATEKCSTIDGHIDELVAKYEAGDISDAAYDVQKSRLERQADMAYAELTRLDATLNQQSAQESQAQVQAQAAFNAAADAFMANPENAVFATNKVAFDVLQTQIDALTDSGLAWDVMLDKARENTAKIVVLPESKAATPAPAPKQQKRTQPAIPPNIGNMPAAVQNDAPNSEFAHVDKLSGIAYEEALARMSEQQRERYLNS
jgi:hypothetical protein